MADFFFLTVEFIIIAVAVPGWSLSFYSPSSSSPSPSSSSPSSSSAKTSLVRQTLTIVKSLLIEGSGWAQFQTITLFIMRKKRRKRARKFWARGDPREKSCGTFGKLFNMVQSCQIGQSCSFYSFRHCCEQINNIYWGPKNMYPLTQCVKGGGVRKMFFSETTKGLFWSIGSSYWMFNLEVRSWVTGNKIMAKKRPILAIFGNMRP